MVTLSDNPAGCCSVPVLTPSVSCHHSASPLFSLSVRSSLSSKRCPWATHACLRFSTTALRRPSRRIPRTPSAKATWAPTALLWARGSWATGLPLLHIDTANCYCVFVICGCISRWYTTITNVAWNVSKCCLLCPSFLLACVWVYVPVCNVFVSTC